MKENDAELNGRERATFNNVSIIWAIRGFQVAYMAFHLLTSLPIDIG